MHPTWSLLAIAAFALLSLYAYFTRNFGHWRRKKVPFVRPSPFFGNFFRCATLQQSLGELFGDLYRRIDAPIFGIFVVDRPGVVVKSPGLIKTILLKDFGHFKDRSVLSNERDDPRTAHMIFFAKSPEWKRTRKKVTSVFTASKLKKNAFPLIVKVAEDMVDFVCENASAKGRAVEAKDVCTKFSTDVITSCAFGINAHSFDYEDAHFRAIGRNLFRSSIANMIRQSCYFFMPDAARLFRLKFFDDFCAKFLHETLAGTANKREQFGAKRNDLIDVVVEMRKDEDVSFEIGVAQAVQFFVAGFESTGSTMAFTLYELSLNKRIQSRLRDEINCTLDRHGKLSYDAIQNMLFLQQCICETLRKYPVLPFLDRTCTKDYRVPGSDFVIEKGTPLYVPLFGLHYDERFFENPQDYDPDRFGEEKRTLIEPFSYLPFGEGPRICVGEKLAMLSAKVGLACLLREFEVEKCDSTVTPVDFEPASFFPASKNGLPVMFRRIV